MSTTMLDFKIEKVLGRGSFGSVYLVTRKQDNKHKTILLWKTLMRTMRNRDF